MKKVIVLSLALLSFTALFPVMGCGGSGSSESVENFVPGATVITANGSRAVRVSWPAQAPQAGYRLVEYHIYRTRWGTVIPTISEDFDTHNGLLTDVVGRTDPGTTSFVDTDQERTISYQVPHASSVPPTQPFEYLEPKTSTAPGISSGNYTYKVVAVYRQDSGEKYVRVSTVLSNELVTVQ